MKEENLEKDENEVVLERIQLILGVNNKSDIFQALEE
jgi:hypothetical protein